MFEDFLKALFGTSESNGIVLRRHFPNSTASYVRIYVLDTEMPEKIYYAPIDEAQAKFALAKQKNEYGSLASRTGFGNYEDSEDSGFGSKEFLPAHLHKHAEPSFVAKVKKNLKDHYRKLFYSGHIDTNTIMAVQPAKNEDPFHKGETGTKSLRSSRSPYKTGRSFSLILSSPHFVQWQKTKPEDPNSYLSHGSSNHTFDLEADSEGTYWLVFRGFLQLQREMTRIAAQAALGGDFHHHLKERRGKRKAMLKSTLRNRKGGSAEKAGDTQVVRGGGGGGNWRSKRKRKRVRQPRDG